MKRMRTIVCVPLIVGLTLIGVPGCSKKSVQSGGDAQSSQQGLAKRAAPGAVPTAPDGMNASGSEGREAGVSPNFPDTSLSNRDVAGGGLRGLDKSPSEERVGAGSGGTLMAKADPGAAGRQMEEIRAEQMASATAGLRDVFFAYDSFAISEEGRQALSRNAEWIKANPTAQLKIEGHCDERGTSAYNLVLGEKRAKAVRNYLVELGVGANRLSVVSYGKERPFCKEHAEACYAQNRRGHLVLKTGK
ncbi:peptidoglycan-associated lipoprotein Pal [Nitrospira moscoviensis]|uniref:Peptidoglycan-associated protein n=1 Tax=Nitrospira moscoviensis TaxID=42253 RepID=A0A0K2GHI3_NITMO|nr:peptidoglycan-associated lipoprotein Pal [Nitrospira moscoviensis]ALA60087.1 Peptidoglycan-associated lipoprotein Pal (Modular protein) [Nitrospira moscoviensis]